MNTKKKMAESNIEEIKQVISLVCGICSKNFSDPRILPCYHTFCLKCLEGTGVGKRPHTGMGCPSCGEEFQIPGTGFIGIKENEFMEILLNVFPSSETIIQPIVCDNCKDEEGASNGTVPTASVYCSDCEQHMCQECVDAHNRMRSMKTHHLRELENRDGSTRTSTDQPRQIPDVETNEIGASQLTNDSPDQIKEDDVRGFSPTSQISNIIDLINMKDYYPAKLTWVDVLTLRGSSSVTGFTLIENLMMCDHKGLYAAMKNIGNDLPIVEDCNDEGEVSEGLWEFANFGENLEKEKTNGIKLHPMDIMNAIYNCCDGITLQILVEKLHMCRLGIPILFPNPHRGMSTFLLWSLRGIVPTWRASGGREIPIVDTPQPIISFLRIGILHHSKSKMLNELLNPNHHDTFFHRDCNNGMSKRINSRGTVEVAWYFPSEEGSMGSKLINILNLRGEASDHVKEFQWLCKSSDLVFLMIDLGISKMCANVRDVFVTNGSIDAKYVICLVANTFEESQRDLEEVQTLIRDEQAKIYSTGINWNKNEERLLTDGEWKNKIRSIIATFAKSVGPRTTLQDIADIARKHDFMVDEDDSLCKKGKSKATQIVESMGSIEVTKRKLETLPLQGELWKTFGHLRKEQCRSKRPDQDIEKFIAAKTTEQNKIRKDQYKCLLNNKSTAILDIIALLQRGSHTLETQYFLNWLKLLINVSMQRLRSNYFKKRKKIRDRISLLSDELEKNSHKIQLFELEERLQKETMGLEHIFREFGQMYEATESCKKSQTVSEKFLCVSHLPSIVASLVLQGFPFELMDGDAAFVPITWVQAVFNKISEITKNKKLFVISIVGIQSSGKSTLLNTMFGSNFAVSVARCTKGLYCMMVPVDKQSLAVDFDYILIIDTEGLRAPEIEGKHHDNELATLVIGLGDVTIVNITGENSTDINDLLQIVVHAMVRISSTKSSLIKPSCMFIHQNVPAIDAAEKLKIEQEKLLKKLDRITAAAAHEERRSNVKHFKDVITYDEKNYSFFMPGLWQGQPPMAPVNRGYSDKVNKIKTILTKQIAPKSNYLTTAKFSSRILDLWDAILLEDFVFSFKNSEEMRVRFHLDQTFTHLQWDLKETSLQIQLNSQRAVFASETEDELLLLDFTFDENKLIEKCEMLQQTLKTYFSENDNKNILVKWHSKYTTSLENLCTDQQHRLKTTLKEYTESKIKQLETTEKASQFCSVKIPEKAMQTANQLRKHNVTLNKTQLSKYFDGVWPVWLKQFDSTNMQNSESIVISAFKEELDGFFSSQKKLLHKELKRNSLDCLEKFDFKIFLITITNNQLSPGTACSQNKTNFGDQTMLTHATDMCRSVFNNIKTYVEKTCYGSDFHSGQCAYVLKKLQDFFIKINTDSKENGFTFTHEFIIHFTVDVCKCSANAFLRNQKHYQDVCGPLAGVQKRKPDFYKLFENTYFSIAKENRAVSWLSSEISKWMEETLFLSFGLVIMNTVLDDESNCFNTKQQFINTILIEIAEKELFFDYIGYLGDQEGFFRKKIKEFLEAILNKLELPQHETKLQLLIEKESNSYISKIENALERLLLDKPFENFMGYLSKAKQHFEEKFTNPIDGNGELLLFPSRRFEALEKMEIQDFERFTRKVMDDLSSVRKNIIDDLYKRAGCCTKLFSCLDFFQGTDPVELMFERVIGCKERCSFCKMPCKYTFKDHYDDSEMDSEYSSTLSRQSDCHNAHQHCPMGLAGFRYKDTQKLYLENCQSSVASNTLFCNEDTAGELKPFKEYKTYYPSWDIAPDRGMETSLYWKWFTCKFHEQLVKHFNTEPADIPTEWKNIQWFEAKQSLFKDL